MGLVCTRDDGPRWPPACRAELGLLRQTTRDRAQRHSCTAGGQATRSCTQTRPGRGPWVHPPGHQVTRIGVPGACHLPTSPSRMLACRALHRPPGTRAEVGGKSAHGPSRALWAQRNGPASETATRQPRPFHRTWGRAPHGSKPALPRRLSGLFSPTQLPSAAEPVRGQQSPGAWAWWSPTHCAKRGLRAQPATGLTPMVRGPRRGRWAKSTRGREPRRSARPGPQGAPSHPHRQQVHLLSQICNKK